MHTAVRDRPAAYKSSVFAWQNLFSAGVQEQTSCCFDHALTAATAVSAFGALLLKDRCVVRAVTLKGMTGHREADCFRVTDRNTGNGRAADKLRAVATFLQETVIVG